MPKGKKTRKQSDISVDLINQAAAGSVDHLYQLLTFLTPENFPVDVVEVALKHLQLDLAPNVMLGQHDDPRYTLNGQRALPSASILAVALSACYKKPKIKAAVLEQLTPSVDALFPWINFFLHFGLSIPMDTTPGADFRKSYFIHSQFLCNLLDLDPTLRRVIFSTPTFHDLLIRFWMTTGTKEQHFMSLDSPKGCPILSLFLRAVNDDEGRDVFLQRVFARPQSFWGHFAESMIERAQEASSMSYDVTSPARVVGHVDGLLMATHRLLIDNGLRRIFLNADYLCEFSSVLNSISVDLVEHDSSHLLKPLLPPLYTLCQTVVQENARVVLGWRDLVAGDFLTVLVRIMASMKRTGDDGAIHMGMLMLGFLGKYTVYPSVIRQFLQMQLPENPAMALYRNPKTSSQWEDFRLALGKRAKVHGTLSDKFDICDNPSCDQISRLEDSKQCARCSSVVYCSEKCQKQDWTNLHRAECSRARGDLSRRRVAQARYHHSSRAFHMAYVEAIYNEHAQDIQKQSAVFYPKLAFHEVMPVLDCSSTRFRMDLEPLTDENHSGWDTPKTVFPQKYLKPRFHALVDDYRAGKVPLASVRLAEAAFPLGTDFVVVVNVKLKKKGNLFKAVYSIFRYGSRESN